MNQNMQIVNLSKGIVTLDGKYSILPGKSITLTVLEYPQILHKINLQKQLGWIDWKFVPVDYSKQETSTQKVEQPVSPVVVTESIPVVEEKVQEPHPASPLISKRIMKKLMKQEGEPKADDSKGTV
jgi:hypothetical protein